MSNNSLYGKMEYPIDEEPTVKNKIVNLLDQIGKLESIYGQRNRIVYPIEATE